MSIRWMRHLTLTAMLFALVVAATGSAAGPSPKGKPKALDLAQGDQPNETHDWNLGATGARGWMWAWRNHTTDARQILVTKVDAGSPADGVLAEGDVILGANGKPFDADARIQFGHALTEAEKADNKGLLRLIRWRKGKTAEVTLTLKVMGSYSATAPYDCEKSRAIFELGCRAIARKGLPRVSIPTDFNALALLASGNKEYRPMLAAYATLVGETLKPPLWWWHYGYGNLFLAEYCLATKDSSALAALRETTLEVARFQSTVGTWGHEHRLTHGLLHGYGAMNQVGLILTLPMVLARKAGVKDPIVDRAIAKSAAFTRWYVDKGSLPYGDHKPWMDHEDNGKNSMGAILYDLLGDGEAATYFSRMATAAHAERENGHTGNFFNVTWALMGVSRSGPNATGAYLRETAWYYDLARRPDGTFVHHGIPGEKGDSYTRWDCTGAFLMAYALDRKSLYITGKGPCAAAAMTTAEAAAVIDDGRNFTFWDGGAGYDHMTDEQLFSRLGSWSPIVRHRAAQALAHHEGQFTPQLVKMLDSGDRPAMYGACEAAAYLGPRAAAAAPKLRALLAGDDPWLLSLAVNALAAQGETTLQAVTPDLLKLAVRTLPADPRRMAQRAVATALFARPRGGTRGRFVDSLDYDDPPALVAAVGGILANEDGRTRGLLTPVMKNLQDDAQLAAYLPAVLEVTRISAPSGIMFADGIRMAGLDLLSRMRIRDGMAFCVEQIDPLRWGGPNRIPRCLAALKRYGANARPLLPQLKKLQEQIRARRGNENEKASLMAKFDDISAVLKV